MEASQPATFDPLHHPVEVIEQSYLRTVEQEQLQQQATMFGRGYALRTALAHKSIAATANWTCGHRTAAVLRDQFDDRHTTLEFHDFLGRLQDNPAVQATVRERMNRAVFGSDLIMKPLA
jgi:hypothetical protein